MIRILSINFVAQMSVKLLQIFYYYFRHLCLCVHISDFYMHKPIWTWANLLPKQKPKSQLCIWFVNLTPTVWLLFYCIFHCIFFFLPYLVTLVFVVGAGCCVIAAGLLWEFLGFFNAHQCLAIAHTDTRLRSQRVVILSYKAKASTWHPVPSPSSRSFAAQLVIVVIRAFLVRIIKHYLFYNGMQLFFLLRKSFGVSFINQAFSIPNVGIVLQKFKNNRN